MKKLILFLFLSTSLFCFGQGKSALKDIQSIKFYGVDYSQVKIFGADESPAQFKDAFRRINELFITEAKKYNVGKQLKKEVTEISLDAVNQVNENIDLTELMTANQSSHQRIAYPENTRSRYGVYRTVPGQIKQ